MIILSLLEGVGLISLQCPQHSIKSDDRRPTLDPLVKSLRNSKPKQPISSSYLLRSKNDKKFEDGEVEGGLAIEKETCPTASRKSHISIAKSQEKKEIREGKQSTIDKALREESTQTNMSK